MLRMTASHPAHGACRQSGEDSSSGAPHSTGMAGPRSRRRRTKASAVVRQRNGDCLVLADKRSLEVYLDKAGDKRVASEGLATASSLAVEAGALQEIRSLVEASMGTGLPKIVRLLRWLLAQSNKSKRQYDDGLCSGEESPIDPRWKAADRKPSFELAFDLLASSQGGGVTAAAGAPAAYAEPEEEEPVSLEQNECEEGYGCGFEGDSTASEEEDFDARWPAQKEDGDFEDGDSGCAVSNVLEDCQHRWRAAATPLLAPSSKSATSACQATALASACPPGSPLTAFGDKDKIENVDLAELVPLGNFDVSDPAAEE